MKKPKITAFSLILALVFVVCAGIFLCLASEFYQATVEDISGDKYFPAVKEALSKAEKSIYMVMYFVNFNPADKRSVVNELVEELVNAHKRGVKVKVILDQNIDFSVWAGKSGEWKKEEKNDALFVYLKQQGIETYYDNLYVVTHSKAIVIDEEIVILGSANWSESSLKKNWEASSLIKSKELAKQVLENFSKITIDYEASILDEERRPSLRLSQDFLTNPSFASSLLASHDDLAFDLYLLLLKDFNGNPEGSVDINYKDAYLTLGMDKASSFVSARVTLVRALNRLEQKYKLIRLKRRLPQSPLVFLQDYQQTQPYALPQERYCSIPDEYWQYGWHKQLSFPEKYCYLINLVKGGAMRGHSWVGYRGSLSKEFNINKYAIIRGMKGLRKLNIIEIEYPDYSDQFPFQEKEPTRFTLLGLYSPEVLMKEKERLAGLYGEELFKKAIKYAEIVYKGNDIQVIEDIIKKIDEYGIEEVDKAFRIVSKKSYSNPKRSYKYVIATLQTEAREKEER